MVAETDVATFGPGAGRERGPDGLDLPPGFRAISLRESKDAMAHACQIAATEGAGTLVWVRRFDTIEFALVLEPDEPLAGARRAIYAAINAAADALAALGPPERPITVTWPDTLLLDGGIIGGTSVAEPPQCAEDDIPDWLVVGITLRTVVAVRPPAAPNTGGHALDSPFVQGASLESEGFEMLDPAALIASFCRHMMVEVDQWQATGFKAVAETYLARLPETKGAIRGIDGNGDLLVRRLANPREPERHVLAAAIAAPGWRDPATGEPWL